jgi:hypothetical protein
MRVLDRQARLADAAQAMQRLDLGQRRRRVGRQAAGHSLD